MMRLKDELFREFSELAILPSLPSRAARVTKIIDVSGDCYSQTENNAPSSPSSVGYAINLEILWEGRLMYPERHTSQNS